MGASAAVRPDRGRRFLVNVLWNWLGTVVSLLIGLALSPYLIRKLGPEGYGVWAITFSLVEYYWLFDLGFRSATVKFVAHYWAANQPDQVRGVISTAFVYSAAAGLVILGAVAAWGGAIERFFQIPASLRSDFRTLVLLITLSWCLGLVFNTFNACLEAVQNFEYSNKASIVAATLRAVGQAALLAMGYKLVAIGVVVVLSQAAFYAVNYLYFRRVFPRGQISFRCARVSTLRELAGFGLHTFVMTVSNQLLNQGPPLLIGHFRPAAFVGFYTLPTRLLQYTAEFVGRIGIVTNTNAAELAARGRSEELTGLAVYANRYALVIFMPLAIVLAVFGPWLLQAWVGAAFASQSAPVLAVLLAGVMIAVVGQSSAAMLLQGLGRHQRYARGLLAEAVAGVVLLVAVIPRWGIVGAAWVVTSLMILNRGVYASWLASRVIGLRFWEYAQSVYLRPAMVALPVALCAFWIRSENLVHGLLSTFALSTPLAVAYYGLAYFVVLEPTHRRLAAEWILRQGWIAQPLRFAGRLYSSHQSDCAQSRKPA